MAITMLLAVPQRCSSWVGIMSVVIYAAGVEPPPSCTVVPPPLDQLLNHKVAGRQVVCMTSSQRTQRP